MKRRRNLLLLIVVQLLLFVICGYRLHRNTRQRSAVDRLQQNDDNNLSMGNSTSVTDQISSRGEAGRRATRGQSIASTVNLTSVDYAATPNNNTISSGETTLSTGNRSATKSDRIPLSSTDSVATNDTQFGAENQTTDRDSAEAGILGSAGNSSDRPGDTRRNYTSSVLYPRNQTFNFSNNNDLSAECQQAFMQSYSNYCEKAIVPVLEKENGSLCSCIPQTLVGKTDIRFKEIPFEKTEAEHPELLPGGRWEPTGCHPRQRVAIIVPYRNRESHLKIFLRILHPFLQRQMLHYTIFVVEQMSPKIFNKAALMNAGFLEIRSRQQFDCFIFHDVDMLPETDHNFYGCYKAPRHIGAYVNKFQYNVLYYGIFGGATGFTEKQFVKLNGYSNEFYGWGGEDDDMFNRVKWSHQGFLRFPKCVARYTMIKHKHDSSNPYNAFGANKAWKMRPKVYSKNGLNSVVYTLVSYEEKPLFTQIRISLPEAPLVGLPRSVSQSNITG